MKTTNVFNWYKLVIPKLCFVLFLGLLSSCQDDERIDLNDSDLVEATSDKDYDSVDYIIDEKGNTIGLLNKDLKMVDLDGNVLDNNTAKYSTSIYQRLVLYKDVNFENSRWAWYGGSLNVLIDLSTYSYYSGAADNEASSAVVPPNCSVTFYRNTDGTDVLQSYPRVPFPRYIVNFVPLNLNDIVSSVRVNCANSANSFAGYAYDGTNYSGKSFPFYVGDDINPRSFAGWSNTNISSIAMNEYSDAHFLHLDDTTDGEFLRAISQNKNEPDIRWKGMESSNVRFLAQDYASNLADTDINTLAGEDWQTINDLYYELSTHQNHPTITVTEDELNDFCITANGQCQASAGDLATEQTVKEFWQEYIGGVFGGGAGIAYLSVANRLEAQGLRPDEVARAFIRGYSKHVTRAHQYLMGEELEGEATSEAELSDAFSNGAIDVAPEAGESVASTATTSAGEAIEVIADSSGEIIEIAGAVIENAVIDAGAAIGAEVTGAAAVGSAVAAGASVAGVEAGEAIVTASVFELGAMTCGIGALVVVGGIGIWKMTHRSKVDQHEDCKIFATQCASSGFSGLFEVGVDYTDPPGQIIARAEIHSGEGKEKAFDNNVNTKWLDNGGTPTINDPCWIQISLPQEKVINRLSITSGNDVPNRDPQNFSLYGSNNNGLEWTLIKSWHNENWSSRKKKREFKFDNSFSFIQYRLVITKNKGFIGMTQVSEIELFGPKQ